MENELNKIISLPISTKECENLLRRLMEGNLDDEYYDNDNYEKYTPILNKWSFYVRKLSALYIELKNLEDLGMDLTKLKDGGYLDGISKY